MGEGDRVDGEGTPATQATEYMFMLAFQPSNIYFTLHSMRENQIIFLYLLLKMPLARMSVVTSEINLRYCCSSSLNDRNNI